MFHAINKFTKIIPVCLYGILSVSILGLSLSHPLSVYVGIPGDAEGLAWLLGHFWYSIVHLKNPLHSQMMNYPSGLNLMWNTSILAEGAFFGWLVYFFTPALGLNTLWTANMILTCVLGQKIMGRLGVRTWLSVVGGLLIGISPYTTAQMLGHVNLYINAPILMIVYLLLLGWKKVIMPEWLGLVLGFLFAFEFYTSLEIFVTFLSTLALLSCLGFLTKSIGPSVFVDKFDRKSVSIFLGTACALTAPGWFELFFGPNRPAGLMAPNGIYVTDLLSLILPSQVYFLHDHVTVTLSNMFTGNTSENNGYLGIPMIILSIWAALRLWRLQVARVCVLGMVVLTVLSMGPYLHIAGYSTRLILPWFFIQHIPFIRDALPCRLMLYVDYMAVPVLIYAFEDLLRVLPQQRKRYRFVAVTVALFSVFITWLPQIPYFHTTIPSNMQLFKASESIGRSLSNHPTVVLASDFTQVFPALTYSHYSFPVVNAYARVSNSDSLTAAAELQSILSSGQTQEQAQYILETTLARMSADRLVFIPVNDGDKLSTSTFSAICHVLGKPLKQTSGIVVWAIPRKIQPAGPEVYNMLFRAVHLYLKDNNPITFNGLYPLHMEQEGYLSRGEGAYPRSAPNYNWTKTGGWIGAWGPGKVGIGVVTSPAGVQTIIKKYGKLASDVYFPYPAKYASTAIKTNPNQSGQLLLTFKTGVLK